MNRTVLRFVLVRGVEYCSLWIRVARVGVAVGGELGATFRARRARGAGEATESVAGERGGVKMSKGP